MYSNAYAAEETYGKDFLKDKTIKEFQETSYRYSFFIYIFNPLFSKKKTIIPQVVFF